jgi:hypothetical protein
LLLVPGINSTRPLGFTVPSAIIKNTTYTFKCGPGTFMCYIGYPASSGWYSYWNAKGSFRADNPAAPDYPVTVRARTFDDDFNPALNGGRGGWTSHTTMVQTVMGMGNPAHIFVERTVTVPTHPPTAMYTRITPTEGDCTNPGTPADCPGTTHFGSTGPYQKSRANSIMITPGPNKFGGTLRYFSGPGAARLQRITATSPFETTVCIQTGRKTPAGGGADCQGDTPISQVLAATRVTKTGTTAYAAEVPTAYIGEIWYSKYPYLRYRKTDLDKVYRKLIGDTTAGGAPCSPPGSAAAGVRPPTDPGCKYYTRQAIYISTAGVYTTGMAQVWAPIGNTNTIQTTTGYDNRTALGLNGTISIVHPRMNHAYRTSRSVIPNNPIVMSWSSARLRKMDFYFMPEPAGIAMLAAGFVTLAGLYRLRRR